eukprot:3686830-Rhodomonas_salina.1
MATVPVTIRFVSTAHLLAASPMSEPHVSDRLAQCAMAVPHKGYGARKQSWDTTRLHEGLPHAQYKGIPNMPSLSLPHPCS